MLRDVSTKLKGEPQGSYTENEIKFHHLYIAVFFFLVYKKQCHMSNQSYNTCLLCGTLQPYLYWKNISITFKNRPSPMSIVSVHLTKRKTGINGYSIQSVV